MRQPITYWGTYPSNWAGYYYKETLGYSSGRHTGVDYNRGVNDRGDAVYAIASGVVADTRNNGQVSGFGNAIIIKTEGTPNGISGNNLYHRYLHLDRRLVSRGQKVVKGQRIGDLGSTGTQAPHLHLDTWTDRNGLGAHWSYHKDTQLSSYEDPYRLIQANPSWDQKGISKIMDTDAKVAAQYYTLRGDNGTSAERKGWIGRSYEEFNATARPEVQGRTTKLANLTSAVTTLTKERDEARRAVGRLTAEILEERDALAVMTAKNNTLKAELQGAAEAYEELKRLNEEQINQLNSVIELNEKEIDRLNEELANCGTDCDNLTGWELIALGIKKLLGRSK